ncbi:hypothetical protein C8R42DRAFT_711206 [Lentinula raphanica]|nr:hypothetical protein C8R42DRAFT_711206 [Lentinula raphanica]
MISLPLVQEKYHMFVPKYSLASASDSASVSGSCSSFSHPRVLLSLLRPLKILHRPIQSYQWPFSFSKSFSKSENKDDAKPPKKVHWEDGETTGKHTGDVASLSDSKNAGNVADYLKGKLDKSSHHEKDDQYIPEVVSEAAALYSPFRAIGSIRNREEKKRSQEEFCHNHYQDIIEGLGKLRILENEIQEHRFREMVKKLRIEYIQKSVLSKLSRS